MSVGAQDAPGATLSAGGDGAAPSGGADTTMSGAAKELELHEKGIIGWNYVTGIGEQLITNSKGEREKTDDLKYYTASDPETMEVLMIREDRVMMVSRPDNTLIVDHNDGTRITTFYKEQQLPPPPTAADQEQQAPEGQEHPSSRQVRFVKVECEGFATLVFNTEDSSCTSFFGSQTNLFAHPTGLYVSSCADGSAIVISQKGQVVYVRKPDNAVIGYLCNCDSFDQLPQEVLRSDVFVLKHNEQHILQHTDSKGNLFYVDITGEASVAKPESETEAEQADNEASSANPRARYFVVNADQSGEELLRHNDIISLLQRAEDDPSIVVLVDPIPEQPNVKGVTVMQPSFSASAGKWLIQKDEQNIIPKNLTSRDLKTIPPREYKKPGPKFGTNVGKGLSIGALTNPTKPQQGVPIYPKMPEVVAMRQFVGYPEVKPELRSNLKGGLKSYCQSVEQRKNFMDSSRKADPRSKEEIERSLALEKKMNERMAQKGQTTIQLEDSDQNPFNSKVLKEKSEFPETAIETYRSAIKPESPPPPVVAKPKRTNSAWSRDKEEILKERENKRKLRNKEIPPYFQSYLAEKFVAQQQNQEINSQLRDATGELPYYAEKQRQHKLKQKDMETSQVIEEQCDPEPETEAPPTNQIRVSDEKEKHEDEKSEKQQSEVVSDPGDPEGRLTEGGGGGGGYDSRIDPGDDGVKLPNRRLNDKFLRVEHPVKRKSNTTSIAGAVNPSHLGALRGFLVRPTKLNFGTLREGYTYALDITLKNIGLENCRFRVKAPPLSTGLSVNYKPPGTVAAGMSQHVELILFALANPKEEGQQPTEETSNQQQGDNANQEADLLHELIITTEVEIFTLPVIAKVLPADEYDTIFRPEETGVHGHSNLAAILSTQPTAPQNTLKRSHVNAAAIAHR